MDPHHARTRLLWHGILIALLSLVEGAFVPAFRNPRMALSAHVGGLMVGMLTALLGLLWADLRLGSVALRALFWLSVYQGYTQAAGLVLAAAFGTSRTTPMAGAGFAAQPWQEAVVAFLLGSGAVAILACCVLALLGLRRPSDANRRAGF